SHHGRHVSGTLHHFVGRAFVVFGDHQHHESNVRLLGLTRVRGVYSHNTSQGAPKRSTAMPKRRAKKVCSMGISTQPSSDSTAKIRSASPGPSAWSTTCAPLRPVSDP